MKTSKKYIKVMSNKLLVLIAVLAVLMALSVPVLAAEPCGDNCSAGAGQGPSGSVATTTNTTDPNCNNSSDAGVQKCLKNNQIVKDINLVVNFLSAGVGIVVIGAIILGGIQYSLAGDNATATSAAKKRITDGLIALAAFIFMFAFLQWLIPGGL
jgi:hypothetical protein